MIYTDLTKKAMKICYEAHRDQTDDAGVPYVFHPLHLAEQMDTEYEVCTALLHDVPEDTDWTIEDLKKAGFPSEVLDAVEVMTRDKSRPYMEYILKIRDNEIACKVKITDLNHNSDCSRLDEIGPWAWKRRRKYQIAKAILEEDWKDSLTGGSYRDLPLHRDYPWVLRVHYSEDETPDYGEVLALPETEYSLRFSGDTILRYSKLCEDGKKICSFPERLSDFLVDHRPEDLPAWLRDQEIPFREIRNKDQD